MVSKTALQAIRALAYLADLPPGAHAGAGAIAEQIDARGNYLGKLLQSLTHEGLVVSQKGVGGGFRLARKPESIRLYDIVNPIDHVGRWTGCFFGRKDCSAASPCPMHERWGEVRDAYLRLLRETSVADLIGKVSKTAARN